MMRFVLILMAAGALSAAAGDDAQIAGIRALAKQLLLNKNAGPESAFCEYSTISQVHGCSGPNRNAVRYRISRNGVVESWAYRSPRESGDPIGYYQGKIDGKQWRGLLRTIAAMKWTEDPIGMGGPPLPPGPTESIQILSLSDGKKSAEYGKTGPAPKPISDAFDQFKSLVRLKRDTIWQLSLINPKTETRKDSVHVTAEWHWRGPPGSRILFSQDAGGEFCGTARFKWFLDTAAFNVKWHEATTRPWKGRTLSWDLPGPKTSVLRLSYPYDGPKGRVKRVGVLDGIGIRLIAGGSKDTVSATVFTDRFNF